MLPPPADRPKLAAVLAQLAAAVEELLLSGLTTASASTRQTLAAATQEAARFRLLRLGSTLRTAAEELGRFTEQDAAFARRRLIFFLNRAWLLSRGLTHALQAGDEKEYDRLTWAPPTQPLPAVDVVCLGVAKKVAAGAFVAFEFRLRAVSNAPPVAAGQRLTWSVVFPLKPGMEIPAEGFLHLPQKQKFNPIIFLEKKTVTIKNASLVADDSGGGRLTLTDQCAVVVGPAFRDFERFLDWSPKRAVERIRGHAPGPLDLDTELQEEIVLRDYEVGPPTDGELPGQTVYPIRAGQLTLNATVGSEVEGKTLRKNLDDLRKLKKNRPPLFGLMHYERCRLVFQPFTAFNPDPDYLMISKENVNKAALLKALSFK
ncbi:hypothetical protein [Fimbriiglobus ruber]|uniref:Uncharacterized protein n=1 Tax=Fimbriiglobus ruber TaxID=1908690 RepID=A0A225DYX9_9BACT|nr:hypothetical protein [Fimbriiglobus ruber]OWK43738.1 hypothetical protein FRUB_03337 [Fimbriiglobus ruber]